MMKTYLHDKVQDMRKAAHAMNPALEISISSDKNFEVVGERVVI
jgi:hypothetical protein